MTKRGIYGIIIIEILYHTEVFVGALSFVSTIFENLKGMGFEVWLFSNTWDERAANIAKKLDVEYKYVSRAEKPLTKHFQELQNRYDLDKSQMAHVGNSKMDRKQERN